MRKSIVLCIAVLIAVGAIMSQIPMQRGADSYSTVSAHPNMVALSTTPPHDVVEAPLYSNDGQRLFFLKETGMVVTEDGVPVMDPSTESPSIVVYNEATQEFVNGANQALAIFLDSRLDRHYLRRGGRYTIPINMDKDVFLINLNTTNGPKLIYAFRERVSRPWYAAFNPTNWRSDGINEYRFSDMNGRVIDNEHIGEIKQAEWWQIGITFLHPYFWAGTIASNGWTIHVVEILDQTTLRELKTFMTHATIHPWETLVCGETGQDVVTEDGRLVYVNPRTGQLTDSFSWALFNSKSGLPIVFHDNDIITTNLQQQRIENAVLLDSLTVWGLLSGGTDFHMHIIQTPFGTFDVPVFDFNPGDPKNPDFRLMNGDSTEGITIKHQPAAVLDGESFGQWFGRMFGSGGGGSQILTIIILVLVALILGVIIYFCYPIITPLMRTIAVPITATAQAGEDFVRNRGRKKAKGRKRK